MGHPEHHRKSGHVAVTLAAAAVLAALLGARAAVLFDHGGGELQSAVRTEVKVGAGVVEDVRFLYEVEAPIVYRYAKAAATARALRQAAASQKGAVREQLLVEAQAQDQLAKVFRSNSEIAKTPKYALPGGAYDLGKRLADLRNRDPKLVALDPAEPERSGAKASWHATLDVATTLAPAIAFLLGALAQTFARRRRHFVALAWLLILAGLAAGIVFEFVLP
jgi:hypothetical protein